MKCNHCDKEAEYIVDGQSVCKDHKEGSEHDEEPGDGKTPGERLAGM